jgi:DNA-binding beta-propeller fold protein YncE
MYIVADYLNHRIQVFDNKGKFLTKWGSLGKQDGQFDHPHGITLDSANMVYVSDSVNNRIQKFTQHGIFITAWGSRGENDGELNIPRDVVADKEGLVYVSDGSNHRIQIFIPKYNTKKSKEAEEIQVRFYTEILSDPNQAVVESSWHGLERLAEIKTIWKYDQVWNAINREILSLFLEILRIMH